MMAKINIILQNIICPLIKWIILITIRILIVPDNDATWPSPCLGHKYQELFGRRGTLCHLSLGKTPLSAVLKGRLNRPE